MLVYVVIFVAFILFGKGSKEAQIYTIRAAKSLAMLCIDIMTDKDFLDKIKQEFEEESQWRKQCHRNITVVKFSLHLNQASILFFIYLNQGSIVFTTCIIFNSK